MAERINGRVPYTRRTHGSERRGVAAVPELNFKQRQEQSLKDRALLNEVKRYRREVQLAEPEKLDLGNKELPAYKHKEEILANIEAYRAVILGGPTGSGKSTQLPQYLHEAGYKTYVLVPRQIIADGLVDRIREEMSSQIEGFDAERMIGVAHGGRSELHEDNQIIILTSNTYNKMAKDISEQYGDDAVAIVPDETHEANIFTDIAIGTASTAVRDHPKWRIIAASATHNANTLQSSFQELNGGGYVPSINIEGRPFNVELQEDETRTTMEVYAEVGHEHEKSMIFTSGKREIKHIIEQTTQTLEDKEAGSSEKVVFRILHSQLSKVELSHLNDPVPEGHRLVIVATPAGMSGITIEGLTLVITDGTINRQELDDENYGGLVRHYLSKAEITQQIGRAGRDVAGGIGIIAKPTMVIEDLLRKRGKIVDTPQMEFKSFSEREEHAPAEIYSSNLSQVVLTVAALDRRFGDINPYIPHPVKSSAIVSAEESLSRLGALDDDDNITSVGRFMSEFPVSPELSRGLYEVRRNGRTLQHMARAALIAAAVDGGGLQDFTDPQQTEWKQLIRPTTADDFGAQLDIMTALEHHVRLERPVQDFVDTYNLQPRAVERAHKIARKILHNQHFNISPNNVIVTHPLPDEEDQLRNDFAAGMIDLVHEEAGKLYRKTQYRNIHGNDESTKRLISDRSVSMPKKGELVAGFPRWFLKRNKTGELIKNDVIEMTLKVDPEVIGAHALANNLLQGKLVSSRIEDNQVVEIEQKMFGSINVGKPVASTSREQIPEQSQKVLVQRVLEKPGERHKALRDVATELEFFHERIPADILEQYKNPDAPAEITKDFIETLVKNYAKNTRRASDIDNQLGHYIYSKNVTINRYYDDVARIELNERSPELINIGGQDTPLLYDKGQPYIANLPKQQRAKLSEPVLLEDGREVLLQVAVKGGGTKRVSLAQKVAEVRT